MTITSILPAKLSRRRFGQGLLGLVAGATALGAGAAEALALSANDLLLDLELDPRTDRLSASLFFKNRGKQAMKVMHKQSGSYVLQSLRASIKVGAYEAPLAFVQPPSEVDRRAMMSRVVRMDFLTVPAATEDEELVPILFGRLESAWPKEMIEHVQTYAKAEATVVLSLIPLIHDVQEPVAVVAQRVITLPASFEAAAVEGRGVIERQTPPSKLKMRSKKAL